jgi:hypothetical protein
MKESDGKVIRRPATREDIRAFAEATDTPTTPTAKAWVGEIDGKVVALGGFARGADGRYIGFVDVTPEGRELLKKNMYVRAAFLRAAVESLREAKRAGLRFVYAKADMDQNRADELLMKLGFDQDPRTGYLYRWSSR